MVRFFEILATLIGLAVLVYGFWSIIRGCFLINSAVGWIVTGLIACLLSNTILKGVTEGEQ